MGKLAALIAFVGTITFPVIVYFALSELEAREVGLLLAPLVLVLGLSRARAWTWEQIRTAMEIPALVAAFLLVGAMVDDQRVIMAFPALVNLSLLAYFGSSLKRTPVVENFARLQDPDLSPDKVAYCRRVTVVWSVFFVLNACACAGLAIFSSLGVWAAYTGGFAYLAIGALGAGEYIVRKWRFRDYGKGPHDLLISKVFPAPEPGRAKELIP